MTDFDIKQEYEKLRKKYGDLPSFEELDDEFELSLAELKDKQTFVLRQIRRRMNDKIVFYCRVLESILYPTSTSPIALYEANQVSKEQKEKFFEIHRKLMDIERYNVILNMQANNIQEVAYIQLASRSLVKYKKDFLELANLMRSVWNKKEQKEKEDYYG